MKRPLPRFLQHLDWSRIIDRLKVLPFFPCIGLYLAICLLERTTQRFSKFSRKQRERIQDKRLNYRTKRLQAKTQPVTTDHNAQNSSTFLSRLPLELRQQIYEECYSGFSTRIFIVRKGLSAKAVGRCSRFMIPAAERGNTNIGFPQRWDERPVALPFVCRQLYHETLEYLYTRNTFHIKNLEDMKDLRNGLLPSQYQNIRSMYVSWDGYYKRAGCVRRQAYSWEDWPEVCERIAALPELERLYVRFDRLKFGVLQPLMGFTSLKKFDVEVSADWARISPSEGSTGLKVLGRLSCEFSTRCKPACDGVEHRWCDLVV